MAAAKRYLHAVEGRDREIAVALSALAAHGDAASLPNQCRHVASLVTHDSGAEALWSLAGRIRGRMPPRIAPTDRCKSIARSQHTKADSCQILT
jgi:hypothetical protein